MTYSPLRNQLLSVCILLGLAVAADAQALSWDFWDGTGNDNGWMTLNGTAGFRSGDGGGVGPGPGFAHDGQHVNFLFESPEFNFNSSTIDGTNVLQIVSQGGQGQQGGSVTPYSNPAAIPTGNTTTSGLKGFAFLNTATNNYDYTFFKPNNGAHTQNFTASDLTSNGVNLANRYRLHFYETDHGGWGWNQLNSVEIAGSLGPVTHEIGGDNAIGAETLIGMQQNEMFGGALSGARTIRLTQNLNSTFQIAEIEAFEEGTGINQALQSEGGTATAKDSAHGTNPTLVNDGNLAQNHPNPWHSASSSGTWVQVDLGEQVTLDSLTIYGRSDCCQNRQDDFTVSIQDNGGTEIFNERVTGLGSSSGNQGAISLTSLVSADIVATLNDIDTYVFEIDGTNSDTLTIDNPDSSVFTTVLDINDATIVVEALGDLTAGETYQIFNVDQIVGTYDDLILPTGVDGSNLLIDGTVIAAPEPGGVAIWLLLGSGLLGIAIRRLKSQ